MIYSNYSSILCYSKCMHFVDDEDTE